MASQQDEEFVDNQSDSLRADFETAIEAAGFGLFNILLLFVAMFAASATVFETSTISYILPSAECDLSLSLLDKGILNAVTYAGMITSAIAWGYVADTYGRKKLLIGGYLLEALFVIAGAVSQNVLQLMVCKFLSGFVACGPFATLMSYLTELHGKKYRARVMMFLGMMFTVASLVLPALALVILPRKMDVTTFGLTFHSWQIFLAVSSFPSLISGLILLLFPESPKFLMSQGRNSDALKVFRRIHAMNHPIFKGIYPIKFLMVQLTTIKDHNAFEDGSKGISEDSSVKNKYWYGLGKLRPLFMKPYLGLSLQVYLLNFFIMAGKNTVRLWLPQLFASSMEFGLKTSRAIDMCSVLEYSSNKTEIAIGCEVVITPESYLNNMIVAISGFIGYIIAGLLVNFVGGKIILYTGLAIAGTCGLAMYWSSSSLMTLILSAIFVTMGSISSTSVISTSINLIPTSVRTIVVSLCLMFGRCGSLIGNILFPASISLGCFPPFVLLSFSMFFASLLSIFLPNADKVELK